MSKTVKVRIAVAVDHEGNWYAIGHPSAGEDSEQTFADACAFGCLEEREAHYWITAEVPVPDADMPEPEIAGEVSNAD
jgi:hypothetical protein